MENSTGHISMKALARVLTTLAPGDASAFSYNGITQQLLPFLKCLRWVGRFPFVEETVEDPKGFRRISYNVKMCWNTKLLASYFTAVIIMTSCILGVLHSQSQFTLWGLWPTSGRLPNALPSRSNLPPTPLRIVQIFEIVYTVVIIVEFFIVWLTSSDFTKWLNAWNDIENEVKSCPGMDYNLNLSKFWKYYALPYILCPTLAFGTLTSVSELDIRYPVGILISILLFFVGTACLHMEDIKVVAMFKVTEMSFEQVKNTIKVHCDKKSTFQKNFDILTKAEIRAWKRILIKIRNQAECAGKYLALHQLISIATLIFFAAASLFVTANLIGEQPGNETIPLLGIFTMISFTRLFIKIFTAVQITEEEQSVASLLRNLELVEENEDCQEEVKSIYEMLIYSPTEISLNNYVTLNNSLILSIFSQVLTQFIVYQQFKNSK